jgi:hypothetical protein
MPTCLRKLEEGDDVCDRETDQRREEDMPSDAPLVRKGVREKGAWIGWNKASTT